ncbi:Ribosome biogenesis protein [Friedmanniomyces endolithicus]|uniref:Ribosome biogenesis protein NSA2 homolog n=1 Tax=Friedmanniomyces endolithicus TaxID=329885 RepID=A0AAN6KVK5_9PEZI|nr:Ribosome biogenesis protein [Friedmanniomyces endolithicus]KAK0799227.1 Ribosome biogenesis protein [Friedmanniomyces endolithicus]KAK0814635.1 Ribosome biogenesis protein [Friedmanniomyces endolithicus]KAK0847756.1 Ribosome biogenesis protein [Friedmanniomyces endolithicus]KAK0881400.1 Ribosome biogenesis protein [Friedmanniomyces endolithicus]
MPQNEYIERFTKQHGRRLDHEERTRKRAARETHHASAQAQGLRGLRAKLHQQKRHKEKIQMKKQIKQQEEKNVKGTDDSAPTSTPLPPYLLDRGKESNAKVLSSAIKNKRAEKAAKFSVPLPKVRGISEEEMFKVVKTGKKTAKKSWKRMITKPTFVGPDFTRRPVKYERFIRPMGLRYKKANVTHPELGVTVQLPILSVKKNPQSPMYTQLGVLTKGTIVEVNVSELGIVTAGGKVVWGRWAQITNNCEMDGGCDDSVIRLHTEQRKKVLFSEASGAEILHVFAKTLSCANIGSHLAVSRLRSTLLLRDLRNESTDYRHRTPQLGRDSFEFTAQTPAVPDTRVCTLLGTATPHEQAPRAECAEEGKHKIGKPTGEAREGRRCAQYPGDGADSGEGGCT